MRMRDWSSDVCSSDLLSQQAFAGGTANDNQSTMGIATAGAGQAAEASDASVIFFNPAALPRFKRIEVLNVASIATFDNYYTSTHDSSDERRDGKECFSTCRSRCAPY